MYASFALAGEKNCGSVRDAEKLWDFDHHGDAISCLEQDIFKSDAKANFTLGRLHFLSGNRQAAREYFDVPAVKSAYSEELFAIYKNEAEANIKQSNFPAAGNIYDEAVKNYKPTARRSIANDMFEKGKATGMVGYFDVANRLDSTVGVKISQYYCTLSQSTENMNEKMDALAHAAKFNKKYVEVYRAKKERIGRGYLEQAKAFAKKIGKESETDKYKALARKYLSDDVIESELPDVVKYHPSDNKYRFPLTYGEQSSHWIIADGFDFGLFSEKECIFDMLSEGGRITKKGENRSTTIAVKFKLRAYSVCTQNGGIGLLVK